jgi:GTP-binding protein EngB required for normal cell division
MTSQNRLFLGNPGTGKSTLINCLVGASNLKSGLSWGGGLTQDYQCVDHDGITYMDTPGLADETIQKQAAKAITTALQQGGRYKLFFMMRLQNGRVVSEDLVTLERVLGAIDVAPTKIRFSVIFNNVDKKQYNSLTQPDSDAFKSVHNVVNGRQVKTDAFCFIPAIAELDEASDAVITLPEYVRDFMDKAPSMKIDPRVVKPVDPRGFQQQARMLQAEMDELLKSRAAMMAAMATQQQQNEQAIQRERAQARSVQGQGVGVPLSPRGDYMAHSLTPPIAPAGDKSTKKKKILVAMGAAVGIVALGTVIAVVTTHGGGKGSSAGSGPAMSLPPYTTGDGSGGSGRNSSVPDESSSRLPTPTAQRTPAPAAQPIPQPTVPRVTTAAPCATNSLPDLGVVFRNDTLALEQPADVARALNTTYYAVTARNKTVAFFNTPVANCASGKPPGTSIWTVYEGANSRTPEPSQQAPQPTVDSVGPTLNPIVPEDSVGPTPKPSTSVPATKL